MEEMFRSADDYEELMMMYSCAIREVRTKLEVLNDELSVRYNRNPIEFITTRLKKPISIAKKLESRGMKVSIDNIVENLNDVAGVRVICSFIDDIYDVAKWLSSQDDIVVIETKDYIQNPKPNGYRSLHLIVEIPVFFSSGKRPMRVEVQIRTIAMDFWASLEHQLRYKRNVENSEEIGKELKECAEVIAETDLKMQNIREKIGVFTELT
ncbi:MAG: GTP pyrophosphokinase family protein [Candidatus Limivivens sp.]|nr:GTP pyrophosphokinase family protein [Candidatus Limivivens sp.]